MSKDELRLECLKIAERYHGEECITLATRFYAFIVGEDDDAALGRAVRDLTSVSRAPQ